MPQGIVARCLPMPLPLPLAKNETLDTPVHHIRHISRTARTATMPTGEHTTHLPCDMDLRGGNSYMFAFPNHCIWAYNNRYKSEGHFRIYKTYQLEAFFFGQYHERLSRYEMEPHNYDYD